MEIGIEKVPGLVKHVTHKGPATLHDSTQLDRGAAIAYSIGDVNSSPLYRLKRPGHSTQLNSTGQWSGVELDSVLVCGIGLRLFFPRQLS